MQSDRPLRIGVVVGEMSGDNLGAGLIAALQARYSDIQFEGIAGPKMQALGMASMFPMERLSVMGLVEPLKRLPELLGIRKALKQHFLQNPPDVFIGVDSPDFTLNIEKTLKQAGIPTVHYVSPSVWAWRQKRVFNIKASVDMMLCLLPFEKQFYDTHDVPAKFIGHPLVKNLSFNPFSGFQRPLTVTLMPGSRRAEVNEMADVYMATAEIILKQLPDTRLLLPAANANCELLLKDLHESWLQTYPAAAANLEILSGDSHRAIAEADFVICTSGTTTLEVMLMGVPMLLAYRMHWLSYWIISRMVKTPYIGLPNIIADKLLVPEFVQQAVTPEALAEAALRYLQDEALTSTVTSEYKSLRTQLDLDANELAADAVIELISND